MDNAIKSIMKHGEQMAPVKSIKVKFQKADSDDKGAEKRAKALEKSRKAHSTPH